MQDALDLSFDRLLMMIMMIGYMFRSVNRSSSGLQQSKSQVLFYILGYQYLHLRMHINYDTGWNVKIMLSS